MRIVPNNEPLEKVKCQKNWQMSPTNILKKLIMQNDELSRCNQNQKFILMKKDRELASLKKQHNQDLETIDSLQKLINILKKDCHDTTT